VSSDSCFDDGIVCQKGMAINIVSVGLSGALVANVIHDTEFKMATLASRIALPAATSHQPPAGPYGWSFHVVRGVNKTCNKWRRTGPNVLDCTITHF
jgi:hypothetical protein